jgi:hypothetical protein
MQTCDQYDRILLVSGVISKKSQQRSASFLERSCEGPLVARKAVILPLGWQLRNPAPPHKQIGH